MLEVKNVFLSIFLAQNQNKTLQKGETGISKSDCLKKINHNLQQELFKSRIPFTFNSWFF